MPHQTALIVTLVLGFVFAAVCGFGAKRLGLSPLIGYLVAGIIVGPYTPGPVADAAVAHQLSEVGLILLMFGVGLHFSIGDLLAVRRIATVGAIVQIVAVTAIAFALARHWGWGPGGGLVLGIAVAIASTVVLLRALEDHKLSDTLEGRIAVGWLVVEDLATVLVIVLLPALAALLAGSGTDLGSLLAVGLTLGKVALFVALALLVGRRVVPWLLHQVALTGSRELFTLAVLGIAIGVAYAASELFDVSLALGAFTAGVVLSESDLSYQAAADVLPLQDAFAVLFFVTVGMLFNFWVLLSEPDRVLEVVLVIMVAKPLVTLATMRAFRYPLHTQLTLALGLAQIGEFSFILAAMGVELHLLPEEGRDLVLAGAILSIALNSLLMRGLAPLARALESRPWLRRRLEPDESGVAVVAGERGPKDHAVLVGYGRVGGLIAEALKAERLEFVVIERNRALVDKLRKSGLPAIFGDGSAETVLAAAGLARARLLIVAVPGAFKAAQVLVAARKTHPAIDTLVRAHSAEEMAYLEAAAVGKAVMGERELALVMMGYALKSLGLDADNAAMVVARFAAARPGAGSG